MFASDGTMGRAEWIIAEFCCLVFYSQMGVPGNHNLYHLFQYIGRISFYFEKIIRFTAIENREHYFVGGFDRMKGRAAPQRNEYI